MRNLQLACAILTFSTQVATHCAFVHAEETPPAAPVAKPDVKADPKSDKKDEKKEDAPKKSRFGPRDVEVTLKDGSVIRGRLESSDSIVLKTRYGTLSFPVTDIIRIEKGDTLSEKDAKDILVLLKDLDSDEFSKRADAQYKIESFGAGALEVLKEAQKTATPEVKNRIDTVVKKLTAKGSRRIMTEDAVKSSRFEASGELQLPTFTFVSKFGSLSVQTSDLQTVRWLDRGERKNTDLDPNSAISDWVDSGIDSVAGVKMVINVAGTITLFGSTSMGPTGTNNWGSNGPFQIGSVIGRLGANGDPFMIGKSKTITPDSKERLFLKIFCTDEMSGRANERSKGQFTVKIGTGTYAEEQELRAD